MNKKELNLDISSSISELERLMKEFQLKKILYRLIFRGKGLEFDGYRDFSPDDDAIFIDWKASSRANKLLVRTYVEERDLKILFVMDVSDNMLFGSTEKLKCEYAAELAAALSHLMINSGDAIGFVFFNEKVIKLVPPLKGIKQFEAFVGELSNPLNYGGISDIKNVIDALMAYINKSIDAVFLISDFIRVQEDFSKTLAAFSDRFETTALMVKDPLDKTLPKIKGEIVIEDPVTKQQMIIDPSIAGKKYEQIALEQENMVKKIFSNSNVDILELTTNKPFMLPLAEFLKERADNGKFVIPQK